MTFFCSHHRKPFTEIKAHLVSKNTSGTGTRPVALVITVFNNMRNQLKILLHRCKLSPLVLKGNKARFFFNNKIIKQCGLIKRFLTIQVDK